MRLFAVLLICLTVSACASPPPYRTEYLFNERAVLPFDEAVGLTSAELAQRLGFRPPARRIVQSAELKDGAVVEIVRANGIVGDEPCPKNSHSTLRWRKGSPTGPMTVNDPPYVPDWTFRDGRYVWDGLPERRPGVDGRLPVYFVAACVEMRSSGGGARPIEYVALPLALPYLAVVGTLQHAQPDVVAGQLTHRDVNKTLSTLSLGAPPPGGFDAWLAKLPPHVTLIRQGAGTTVVSVNKTMPNSRADDITLRVYTQSAQVSGDVVVTFEKGVATKLEIPPNRPSNRHLCELTPARSFQCVEEPEGRKPFINLTNR